ncbi:hypothetical protein PG989_004486 [Apiospora arundinis]
MVISNYYLEGLHYEDQNASRTWSVAFYSFRYPPKSTVNSDLFIDKLRTNLCEAIKCYPRFGAQLDPQTDGRIKLIPSSSPPNLLHETVRAPLSFNELKYIVERPDAAQHLGLRDPTGVARIDVALALPAMCIVFRAHHSIADGSACARFVECVVKDCHSQTTSLRLIMRRCLLSIG